MLITKLQNAAIPLQIYAKNPILCNTLISCAEKDTQFPRRTMPRLPPGGLGTVCPRRRLHFYIPGWFGGIFPRRRLHFSVPGGKDTLFPRRTVPRSIPGGLGTVFPRRRQLFSIPRGKRYPIPAQNRVTEAHPEATTQKNAARPKPCCVKNRIVTAYLQTIISRIILSVVCIPSAPMRPRLQMVFSIQSSIIPSFEDMQMLSIARTAA